MSPVAPPKAIPPPQRPSRLSRQVHPPQPPPEPVAPEPEEAEDVEGEDEDGDDDKPYCFCQKKSFGDVGFILRNYDWFISLILFFFR